MLKLYTCLGSGNAYKAELLLHLLGLEFDAGEISIPRGGHQREEVLRITPLGQIPVLIDGDAVYTDSQAILCYLARAYGGEQAERWLPVEPGPLADVMRWLSFAANEIQNGPTMARACMLLKWEMDYTAAVDKAYKTLRLLDRHLAQRDWVATNHMTIADIACYPYILVAAEGGIDTRPFAHVQAWMKRIESVNDFWPMPRIPGLPPVDLQPVPDLQ